MKKENIDKILDWAWKIAFVGIFGGIATMVISDNIKYRNKLNELYNADSTIECSGTIWGAWKNYGEKYGIRWEDYQKMICEINNIKDPDFPKTFRVPVLKDVGVK